MEEKDIIHEILALKIQKRKGWLISGRNLDYHEVESVADHSWGAAFLAIAFLSEDYKEMVGAIGENKELEGYNKNIVIKMLIVHDIMEAKLGDVPLLNRTSCDDVREREYMQEYKDILREPGSISSEFIDLWEEFDAQNNINAKIARDIDRLECYFQLFLYKDKLIRKNGHDQWRKLVYSWRNNLDCKTPIGKWMQRWIEDSEGANS